MTRTSSRFLLALLLALPLMAACHKPTETYSLVSRHAAQADGGRFTFELDLDDPACTYATGIAARLNANRIAQPDIELQMSVVAPDGKTAIERVSFPLKFRGASWRSNRDEGSMRDYYWPWRENIRVGETEAGRWRVVITLPDTTQLRAVEGIGLTSKVTKWEKEN